MSMTPREIDERLQRAFDGLPEGDAPPPAELNKELFGRLTPVRPIASTGTLVLGFMIVFVAVSLAGAAVLGMYGVRALNTTERLAIFSMLTAVAGFAAVGAAREMRPAGGRRIAAAALLASLAASLIVFAILFHDFRLHRFMRQGVSCLIAGLIFAIPAGLVISLVLRRGFVLNLMAAGLAAGTLAGLAGLGVLELHCPNLNAAHLMVWHVAVVAVSAFAGLLTGWMFERRRSLG